jgi:adenylate cyclase
MSIVAELEDQLRWKTRSIAIIREIDRLRDQLTDEQELTSAFMSRLTEEAETDLSVLFLRNDETHDKCIGDSVMCFFNAPERQHDHALRAVRLALDMQNAHHQVMERWRGKLELPPIGIGISTGDTMVGNFGSIKRLEYTVIGHDVNLAARLCAVAAADQILLSEATYQQVKDQIIAEELPPIHLKGIEFDVRSWSVQGLR